MVVRGKLSVRELLKQILEDQVSLVGVKEVTYEEGYTSTYQLQCEVFADGRIAGVTIEVHKDLLDEVNTTDFSWH